MKHPIFLIMTDQHRLDTMHYANPSAPCHTPHLDALAADSLCFTNAYTTAPVCTPARASLYTGLYPSVTGMCTNLYQAGCQTHELADTPDLLSRQLHRAGYACGYTGKWHLGLGADKTQSAEGRALLRRMEAGYMGAQAYRTYGTLPSDVGFCGDDFPGHGDGGQDTPQFLNYLDKAGLTRVLTDTYGGERPGDHSRGGIIRSGEQTTVEYYLAERAIALTRSLHASQTPFFLSLNFWGPHEPYYVLDSDLALYDSLDLPPWPGFAPARVQNKLQQVIERPEQDWSFFARNLRHYYAAITGIDRQIGRFLQYLRETGLYDQSYILFCADHGDMQGCHGGMENKGYGMYEETVKIPLMLKPPHGKHMVSIPHLVNTCDLFATILDIAGGTNFQSGRSLLPYLHDPQTPLRTDTVTESIGVFPITGYQRMYRTDRYKYVFYAGGSDELYDLADDPHELRNRIDDPALQPVLHRLQEGLADFLEANGDPSADCLRKVCRLGAWAPSEAGH